VLYLHEQQIEQFGGALGVRDMGALESAIFRPQTGYYDDIIAEAAAMLESLAMNHPFIDGNKRAAMYATEIFLEMNGYQIIETDDAIYTHMIHLFESSQFQFAALEPWLRGIATPF